MSAIPAREYCAYNNTRDAPRVALVSFDSLGDTLIYLMVADNLRRNGFRVTFYGSLAHQMREWLPQLDIRLYPFPAIKEMETELEDYDLAIVSPPGFLRARMDEAVTARLREKWLLVCQKAPGNWRFNPAESLREKLAPEKFQQLANLFEASGSIRFRPFRDESVVEMTCAWLRERLRLENVTKTPALQPPAGLFFRKYPRRIVVSPDSAGPEKKDRRPASFLALCRRLKARGFFPEIVVAPKRHTEWIERTGHEFPTPRFDAIGALCAYLYESGCVVANDSGNGHLASFLGVPVVTIYRKPNPRFHWRPDFAPPPRIFVHMWRRGVCGTTAVRKTGCCLPALYAFRRQDGAVEIFPPSGACRCRRRTAFVSGNSG
ncbi:MAG: hypothetical protein LBF93_00625 [Zoogloeaceae bacterium]|jgi:hypothetical protein|nr:hypothetical protein [Zoogloeaceae bacterium]